MGSRKVVQLGLRFGKDDFGGSRTPLVTLGCVVDGRPKRKLDGQHRHICHMPSNEALVPALD